MSIITPRPVPAPIPVGNPMKLTVTFVDELGALFDPDHGVQIHVVDPSGNSTTYIGASLTRESIGVYSKIIAATIAGDWIFRGFGFLADNKQISTPDVVQVVIGTQIV